jgi:hypothetical protein
MIRGFHGNRNVRYFSVYLVLCSRQRSVAENDLPVPLVRGKVGAAVLPDESAKPLPHIQQLELGK